MGIDEQRTSVMGNRTLLTALVGRGYWHEYEKRVSRMGFTLLTLIVLASCASSQLSSSEQDYLRRILSTPTEFEIPEDSVQQAWMRAQSFIETYGTSGLQNVTDTIIRTTPPNRGVGFRYTVTRTPQGQTSRISIEVLAADLRSGPVADRNARILADYMQTGELPYPDLIAR